MVKLPGLEDLKKIGSDLIDSAKSVNLSGVMDKFKSEPGGQNEPFKRDEVIEKLDTLLSELHAAQAAQTKIVKKIVNEVAKIVAANQQPTEGNKSDESKTRK